MTAFVLGGARTPFGRFGGALRAVPSVELAAFAMRATLDRTGIDPTEVDEVYSGVTIPAEEALDGSIPARVAALRAGIPEDRLSLTVDRACCSAMTAVHLAARAIAAGAADVVLAGGADNMGRAAFLMTPEIRWGIRRGGPTLKDPMAEPGADIGGTPVAVDAGEVAAEHGITREETDRFALHSHRACLRARDEGFFDDEIVGFRDGDGVTLTADEGPRADTDADRLGGMRTIFDGPLVTAGNAPGQDAGACYVVVVSERYLARTGRSALARVAGVGSVARAPREIAIAPAPALERAVSAAGWTVAELDGIEINEAFACVPLASVRVLAAGDPGVEQDLLARLNVNGGAVAIGHPPGASGARLVLTLGRRLHAAGGGRGAASICGGLGQADAVALEVA